ncbi:type II secretion system F family protein [Mycobacteroides abscessus]|uniref:type II secretion system F family protein n=1 Tax=Mycobacteroides abscessus TaxID=36809 RepID=UPI000C2607FD|nr:type II secretion system F family protein [Mycobacteroides abscessus]
MTPQALVLLAAALLLVPQRYRRLDQPGMSPVRWTGKLVAAPLSALALTALWLLPLSVVVSAVVVAGTGALRWRRRRRSRVESEELDCTASGLDVVVGELRVGAHPVRAFEIAAVELNGAAGEAFAAIAARARLGVNVDRALPRSVPARAQWNRITRSWSLAQRHGLAVADLLDACRADLQERQQFTARVNAGLAGPRATAVVLTGLPVAGIGLGQMIGARPLSVLCAGGVGGALLVVGVTLACAGLLWADAITGKALR